MWCIARMVVDERRRLWYQHRGAWVEVPRAKDAAWRGSSSGTDGGKGGRERVEQAVLAKEIGGDLLLLLLLVTDCVRVVAAHPRRHCTLASSWLRRRPLHTRVIVASSYCSSSLHTRVVVASSSPVASASSVVMSRQQQLLLLLLVAPLSPRCRCTPGVVASTYPPLQPASSWLRPRPLRPRCRCTPACVVVSAWHRDRSSSCCSSSPVASTSSLHVRVVASRQQQQQSLLLLLVRRGLLRPRRHGLVVASVVSWHRCTRVMVASSSLHRDRSSSCYCCFSSPVASALSLRTRGLIASSLHPPFHLRPRRVVAAPAIPPAVSIALASSHLHRLVDGVEMVVGVFGMSDGGECKGGR
ncbi:hypothetical protein BDZ97DRAFT_1839972 [Flammula alnicola]|nr:hypothetical protein BDZ97DRAFT_1839972 [Flammula alnicola]